MSEYKARIIRGEDQVNNMNITQISRIDKAKFFNNTELYKLNTPNISKEENKRYEAMIHKLADLGIHIRIYSSLSQNIQHPDGKHTYRKDATEAQRILENGQELSQELLERLAYYKPIIDKQLETRK